MNRKQRRKQQALERKEQESIGKWKDTSARTSDMKILEDIMPSITMQVKTILETKGYKPIVYRNANYIVNSKEFNYDCFLVTRIALQEYVSKQKFYEYDVDKEKWKGISTKSFISNRFYCCACTQTAFLTFFSLEFVLDELVQVGKIYQPSNNIEALATKHHEEQFKQQYPDFKRYQTNCRK